MMLEKSIEDLAESYFTAKQHEAHAIETRRAIGKELEALIDGPAEGTSSYKGDHWNVAVHRKFTRSVDTAALKEKWSGLSEESKDAFKWAAELSLTKYRTLDCEAKNEVDTYITCKPAASTIEVKMVEEK